MYTLSFVDSTCEITLGMSLLLIVIKEKSGGFLGKRTKKLLPFSFVETARTKGVHETFFFVTNLSFELFEPMRQC